MMKKLSILTLTILALSLTACGDVRQSLGLGRNPPDEFAVVDRAPLAMPPDFSLRPPMPGAERPQETTTTTRASEALFGKGLQPATAQSGAEKALMSATGADSAPSDIRDVVDRETSQKVVADKRLIDQLLWWRDEQPAGTTVDAAAETARIKASKEQGEALNKGSTPVIERGKTGLLGF